MPPVTLTLSHWHPDRRAGPFVGTRRWSCDMSCSCSDQLTASHVSSCNFPASKLPSHFAVISVLVVATHCHVP